MAFTRKEAEEKILSSCLRLVETGLIARTWGNISARLSDEEFLITPSGRAYETLTPEELVVVKIKDHSYEGEIKFRIGVEQYMQSAAKWSWVQIILLRKALIMVSLITLNSAWLGYSLLSLTVLTQIDEEEKLNC